MDDITTTPRIAPSNHEQLRAWDGGEGTYWATHAERFDRSVARYHGPLMEAAAVSTTDRALDIGCGSGETTRDAGRAASHGEALGVDLSSQMLEVARRLSAAEGLTNVGFEQVDAQIHPFSPESFDVAISRTGSMFFGDAVAAWGNIARALRRGGRLALLVWQPLPENEWFQTIAGALSAGRLLSAPPPDAPGPFSMSDPDRVRGLLTDAGFSTPRLVGLRGPMRFGDTAEDAHAFIVGLSGWMLKGLDAAGQARALDDLMARLRAHETGQGVDLGSATWLITAVREH